MTPDLQMVKMAIRILRVLVMIAAVTVMTQQSNAPFVYGGF
jgi:hypothetical protein